MPTRQSSNHAAFWVYLRIGWTGLKMTGPARCLSIVMNPKRKGKSLGFKEKGLTYERKQR